jgi:hypothetical protein
MVLMVQNRNNLLKNKADLLTEHRLALNRYHPHLAFEQKAGQSVEGR